MSAPTDLPSMVAEIKAKIFANGVGAITAATLQQVLLDTLNVLDLIATQAGAAAGAAAGTQAVVNVTIGPAAVSYLAGLPTQPPAQGGQLWWDGGMLAMS